MQLVKVDLLKNHPLNTYFFDDMTGQKWEEFKASVQTSGIIEPVVCTKGMTIISGHQRVRACRELEIPEIMCEIRNLDDEQDKEEITKQLIETNIRQRGNINCSAMQMSRIIEALEPFYGVQRGNNQHKEDSANCTILKTQEELAAELGFDIDTYKRFKRLGDLIPEFQAMVEEGNISYTTAAGLVSRLSPEEQKALSDALPVGEKVTAAIAKQYLALIEQKEHEVTSKEKELVKLAALVKEYEDIDRSKESELDKIDERQAQKIQELEAKLADVKAAADEELIQKNYELQLKEKKQMSDIEDLKKSLAARQDAYEKVKKQLEKTVDDSDEIDQMAGEIKELEEAVSAKDEELRQLRAQLESHGTMAQKSEFTIYRLQDIAVNVAGECYAYSTMVDADYLNVSLDDLLATNDKLRAAIDGLEHIKKLVSERTISINKNTKGVA